MTDLRTFQQRVKANELWRRNSLKLLAEANSNSTNPTLFASKTTTPKPKAHGGQGEKP